MRLPTIFAIVQMKRWAKWKTILKLQTCVPVNSDLMRVLGVADMGGIPPFNGGRALNKTLHISCHLFLVPL